jgi:hypothetical protein
MMFVCMDANFRLKNQLVSNYSQDPGLGIGMAYMVPREPYERYVLSRSDDNDASPPNIPNPPRTLSMLILRLAHVLAFRHLRRLTTVSLVASGILVLGGFFVEGQKWSCLWVWVTCKRGRGMQFLTSLKAC